MIIGSILEKDLNETRTPLTPDVVKKLTQSGHTIFIEQNLGQKSFFDNQAYIQNGAIVKDPTYIYQKADILLQISPPLDKYLKLLNQKQILIADFSNFTNTQLNATFIRLEKVPEPLLPKV